ncbi:MAG: hypothetical protein KC535_03410 [Nanoarchaeota archaeon]|nr:hypothetical protein [Nanoarchaeota archaeon]
MRGVLLIVLVMVVLSACSQIVPPADTTKIPSDNELSSCVVDEDCIPLPSQCHPTRCINKAYEDSFQKPDVCTEIYLLTAAYSPKDCACENQVCINLNAQKDEEPIPEGATKCTYRGEACTREYRPVCGWFGSSVQCIKEPCAVDASNPCEACANEDVLYWTEGACETS